MSKKTKPNRSKPVSDAKVDPYEIGYQLFSGGSEKTPKDYMPDPDTGLRPGETKLPSGIAWSDISNGINGKNIPSLGIWNEGFWLDEWDKHIEGEKAPKPSSTYKERNLWVCSGDGTPTNYQWRIYQVPDSVARDQDAKHPGMWSNRLKDGIEPVSKGFGFGKPAVPPPPKPKPIPHSVHFRCAFCGHFFKENDIATHIEYACPGLHADTDWAMMCANDCGCENLHQASTCKPGFPRPTAETATPEKPSEDEPEQPEDEPKPEESDFAGVV